MSILDNVNNPQPQIPESVRAAQRLKQITRQTYQQMVSSFNQGAMLFWNNPNGAAPQDIADELGVNAKEIFELHAKLGNLLATVRPDSIQEGLGVVGQFTMNNDGTVTVNQPQ